eukprot:gene30214-36506_t
MERVSSATETVTRTTQETKDDKVLVLRLRGRSSSPSHVRWAEGTINNEHMGKKSSKRCCIYHKSKKFAESDSDESDSDVEVAAKQPPKPNQPPNYQRFHA